MKKPLLEKLIQEIAMFDMVAAFTLHNRKHNEEYKDKDNLDCVMSWRQTPECYEHWGAINDKLVARRKNYHPHRDLMIEYANDKSVVTQNYYEQQWCDMSEPAFFISQQYRKKPKLVKKTIECRIYLDTHGEINIVERDAALNISHFKQWLGDWQEVEIEVEEND